VCVLFGVLLAGSSWGKPVRDGITAVTGLVSTTAGKAK
jgi:hypothetical protein